MSLPTPLLSDPSLQVGILNNSTGFTISNGQFQAIGSQHNYCITNGRFGLMELYAASMPEAAHDSSARKYANGCYPGTREQRVEDFTFWVSDTDNTQEGRFRGAWMSGPAGVGKSAIAQTCAERVGKDRLGAAFFFSRPNQRDDPDRLFPSIAYQISTRIEDIATILDRKIRNDISLLTKTLDVQLQELIIAPFLELKNQNVEIGRRVVIIDGLDECQDDRAQRMIVQLIARAMRDHGDDVPLLWAFFSRPEVHIAQTFSSENISPLFWMTTLPVSRELDGEIELFLRGGFENIRKNHPSIPSDTAWPSDGDVMKLVNKTAGLYAYASTAMGYIGDPDALDPKEQLNDVLSLRLRKSYRVNDHSSPTADLDSLYTLIMKRIPANILPLTQGILLMREELNSYKYYEGLYTIGEILDLTLPSISAALSRLRSVLVVDEEYWSLRFHHASFMEFLVDVNRSGPEFCILQPRCYEFLVRVAVQFMEGFKTSEIPFGPFSKSLTHNKASCRANAYGAASKHINDWLELASIGEELALLLVGVDSARHRSLWVNNSTAKLIFDKFPLVLQDQIIKGDKPHSLFARVMKSPDEGASENDTSEPNTRTTSNDVPVFRRPSPFLARATKGD